MLILIFLRPFCVGDFITKFDIRLSVIQENPLKFFAQILHKNYWKSLYNSVYRGILYVLRAQTQDKDLAFAVLVFFAVSIPNHFRLHFQFRLNIKTCLMVNSFLIRAPIDNGTLTVLHVFSIQAIAILVNIADGEVSLWIHDLRSSKMSRSV
ncbi:hypothetical protein DX928_13670 [Bacillus swezeyi]|nr:hypothetical protein DX928_13670 [Bacillus swezeyi]